MSADALLWLLADSYAEVFAWTAALITGFAFMVIAVAMMFKSFTNRSL